MLLHGEAGMCSAGGRMAEYEQCLIQQEVAEGSEGEVSPGFVLLQGLSVLKKKKKKKRGCYFKINISQFGITVNCLTQN